jgi:hypothetical protein
LAVSVTLWPESIVAFPAEQDSAGLTVSVPHAVATTPTESLAERQIVAPLVTEDSDSVDEFEPAGEPFTVHE